jgi:hypothetical protein
MIAFTIHAYTTDSTEGVLLTEDETMTEEGAVGAWWNKNEAKAKDWIDLESLIAVKRDITQI